MTAVSETGLHIRLIRWSGELDFPKRWATRKRRKQAMTIAIEALWRGLEGASELGGARRIDAELAHDFYASLSSDGRRGLQVITDGKPPSAPVFDAVEIVTSERRDMRWLISIWLRESS